MKKGVRIEFDRKWLFEHRHDETPPYAYLLNGLKKAFGEGVFLKKVALNVFLVVSDKENEAGKMMECVSGILKDTYQLDPAKSRVVSVSLEELSEDEKEESSAESRADAPEEPETAEDKQETLKDCLDRIDQLAAADEFKSMAHEIATVASRITEKEKEAFFFRNYLFAIDDGCGLTTYLEFLKELLNLTGLIKSDESVVREIRLEPPKEERNMLPDMDELFPDGPFKKKVAVLCLDISEWMNKLGTRRFKTFLSEVNENAKNALVVFRVPFIDKEVLERIRNHLSDLVIVQVVSFPPFSNQDLEDCARRELKKFEYEIEDDALPLFTARMTEERSDGHFYGLRTMQKVVRELVYNKCLSNAGKEDGSRVITREDAAAICLNGETVDQTAEEMLSRLVGADAIRGRIEEIVSQIQLVKSSKDLESPCIHMRFVGNPGTGKTTVARIIGKMLKEKGVLRIGDLFEYSGRDFCGQYVGHTAPKTAGMCRDAYGSVLFIDEAYSLYRTMSDNNDFGREALDTLIAEMENHRTDLVVIMAGYSDEMDILMKGNPGLASRMPYVIEFPNFTRGQLFDIYMSMVKGKFEYADDLIPAAKAFFDAIPDETIQAKEFSNGRFVRNLFERTWAKASLRKQLSKASKIVLTREDFDRAIQDKEFSLNEKTKRVQQIGFV